MMNIFTCAGCTTLPRDNHAQQSPPPDLTDGYQVNSTRSKSIHPVKRDKSKASMTAVQRSELWKRFQHLSLEQFSPQSEALTIMQNRFPFPPVTSADDHHPRGVPRLSIRTAALSVYENVPDVGNKTADYARVNHQASRSDLPEASIGFVIYDVPRLHSISVIYDIPRSPLTPSHYDIPKKRVIPSHYDIPKACLRLATQSLSD